MNTLRRSLAIVITSSSLLLGSFAFAVGAQAATIAPTVTCNNALGNGGAVCEVTVTNTITPTGGSAVVSVRECQGSAGVPDATCTVQLAVALSQPVTEVNQCNGSISGGGGTLLCSVVVTNIYVGVSHTDVPVTVNQCVGSADMGSVMVCSPFPATTISATITQCNGSSNGGGSSLTCSASGTQSAAHVVTVNQCNGSANGGGTLMVCASTIINGASGPPGGGGSGPGAAPTPTPTPTASPTPSPTPTATPTATVAPNPTATPVTPRTTLPPTDANQVGEPVAPASSQVPFLAILFLVIIAVVARAVGGAPRRR